MLHDQTMDAFPVAVSAKQANAASLECHTTPGQTKTGNSGEAIARSTDPQSHSMTAVLPVMGVVSVAFLVSAQHSWNPVWLTFSAFAVALVAARLFLGHIPDMLGGAKVALVCVFIEAAGLALIWFAPNPALAATGAALTGLGYSLVYPGLGIEAMKRVPPQNRGLAMGSYTVFLDVALGFGSPVLGLLAGRAGVGSVFLASAILALGAAVVAGWLLHNAPEVQNR
jgi:MFS family permease